LVRRGDGREVRDEIRGVLAFPHLLCTALNTANAGAVITSKLAETDIRPVVGKADIKNWRSFMLQLPENISAMWEYVRAEG